MSKREIVDKDTDLQNRKKKKLKKLICWLAIDLSVFIIVLSLLLYKPGQYNPVFDESDEISSSLLGLYSIIYDKSQLKNPFEIVVNEEALNDLLNLADWPMESEGVLLYSPAAVIDPNVVVLMGTAAFQGVEFIVTIELTGSIDEQGKLGMDLQKVKVGAMNVTPLAKMTAEKMYKQKLEEIENLDLYSWQTRILASIFTDEAIEPVFDIDKYSLKIKKISIEQGKIILNLAPIR